MKEHTSSHEAPMNLPVPQARESSLGPEARDIVSEQQAAQALESGISSSNQDNIAPTSSVLTNGPTSTTPSMSSGAQQPASVTTPSVADDGNLIEKAWVEKAKEIVAQTKNDPYSQNQAMNKVKADYLKKRYNREIKISET